MALRFDGEWYAGDSASDLAEFLGTIGANGYGVHEVRHSACGTCAGAIFEVHGVSDERVMKRVCRACGSHHYIADSEQYWDEDRSYVSVCACDEELFDVAVGFSLYADEVGGIRSVATAERCVACGKIDSLASWTLRTGDMGILGRE